MITIDVYFQIIDSIDITALPEALKKGHEFLKRATSNGQDLTSYHESESIQKTIDLYLAKLSAYREKQEYAANSKAPKKTSQKKTANSEKKSRAKKSTPIEPTIPTTDDYFRDVRKMSDDLLYDEWDKMVKEHKAEENEYEEGDDKYDDYVDKTNYRVRLFREINRRLDDNEPDKLYSQDIPPEANYDEWRIEFRDLNKMDQTELEEEYQKVVDVENYNGLLPKEKKYQEKIFRLLNQDKEYSFVERIPEEIRFIKRFINLQGKVKEKDDLLRFINSLQKAILEKRIRKTSSYAEQIKYIQDRLIEVYNSMKGKMTMQIKPDIYEAMKKLAVGEKVLPAINFIKRYIGMNGKAGMKEKAKQLLTQIDRAYEKGTIKDGDAYAVELRQIKKNLRDFISEKGIRTLNIEKATLNGLQGILHGCKCGGNLNGIETVPASLPPVMNSMDFAKVQFRTLGFKGKWLELIGDPTSNFTAMVFGKPKFGKSHFCVEWAGYLARNHGKVLYVAKEEGLDKTLQEKLDDKNVKHPNLDVASSLPENLAAYNFIFLDSVNRLGLSPEDLRRLKAFHPTKSFVYIFQTTKQGNFRGANSFQHDVDIVIEVPEKGKVVQMGRFNQGGEAAIFDTSKY